ncbi:hypothetical protein HK405_007202 [Cladochytrium tenue]|nr:hypothetical protein HK405_007202 [Cladochytrium tenue]
MSAADDDFGPSDSAYKVGVKKTAAELAQLDANDESLRKWKESLGLKAGGSGTGATDPRNVVVQSIAMETINRSDVVIGLSTPEIYEKKFPIEEAPSGMLARGHYTVRSRFIDDDGHVHLEWTWSFDIKKEWD